MREGEFAAIFLLAVAGLVCPVSAHDVDAGALVEAQSSEVAQIGDGRKPNGASARVGATTSGRSSCPKPSFVGGRSGDLHAQIVSKEQRTEDDASLMKAAAIGNVAWMRDLVRLSVVKVKGRGLCPVSDDDEQEGPGKKYAVRYSLRVDADAYLKRSVPLFKQVLQKIQEGAVEDVRLELGELNRCYQEVFIRNLKSLLVNSCKLSGFPTASCPVYGCSLPKSMFVLGKGMAEALENRTFNRWFLNKKNKSKTVMWCSGLSTHQKVEIVLLDCKGEKVTTVMDYVPTGLLMGSDKNRLAGLGLCEMFRSLNGFDSFFVAPMFVCAYGHEESSCVSEIQREVVVRLTNAQLDEVKSVEVRFVGPGKAKRK